MSGERISCDLQPVHLAGSIQRCGTLIAADTADDAIVFGSTNSATLLGHPIEDLLGTSLGGLLGEQQLKRLKQRDLRPESPDSLRPFECTIVAPERRPSTFDGLVHAHRECMILELFDHAAFALPPTDAERFRRRLMSELRKPDTLDEICTVLARTFRVFTAFDRVMVYRFHDDWHGEVVAEDCDRQERFIGLHFPATDIPAPVRQNYMVCPLRLIADAAADPVPIIPDAHPRTGQPLDLTYAKLRSVGPTHVRYLENMGVCATMSIAIVVNGELWGLIACHHYTPKLLPLAQLQLCEIIAQMGASFVERLQYSSRVTKVTAARRLADRLDDRVRGTEPLAAVLADEAARLSEVVPHDGILMALDGTVSAVGCEVDPPPFHELIPQLEHGILVTESLVRLIPLSPLQREAVAGGALLALSEDGTEYVTLARRNYPRVVDWGGGKESEGRLDEAGVLHLSPRRSFEVWQERVDGECVPFTSDERDALTLLHRTLLGLRALERERSARQAQQAAERRETELRFELMQAARLTSMTELASAVAHELNQPLTAVMNYIAASRELLRPYEASVPLDAVALIEDGFEQAERAAEIVRRLRAFIARGELEKRPIDLAAAIAEAAKLALPPKASDAVEVSYDFARELPAVPADRVQIQQVVFNLIRNALEAMADGADRRLGLGARPVGGDLVEAWVSDTGPGITPEVMPDLFRPLVSRKGGMGIGLSLCRSIIEAHGGRIEARNTATGAEFRFSLSTAPMED